MPEYTYIESAQDLSNIVRSQRTSLGWSQAELAQRSGCSQRFVSEFERGKPGAEVGKVLALLHAMGLRSAVTALHSPERCCHR